MTLTWDRIRLPGRPWPRRNLLAAVGLLLLAVLVAIVAWLLVQGRDDGADGRAARAPAPTSAPPEAGQAEAEIPDIFAVQTWEPPAPPAGTPAAPGATPATAPPPEPPVPPAPEPPALPFRFLGRIVDPSMGPAFMLDRAGEILVVRVGDSIGADYLVEQYRGGELVFLYRPMDLRQTLVIGERP